MNTNSTLSLTFRTAAIHEAEACLGAPVGDLSEELYTEFARNGNRVRYEAANFHRRRLLNRLALGELCEGRRRFLPELEHVIACTLSERSWVLPAHSGGKLPEGEETNIDLFSTQTAAALAMISARLPLSVELRRRIWETIDARIFQPFLTRDYWWRDLGENRRETPSNWTPWCIHGVLECARAIMPDIFPWSDVALAHDYHLDLKPWREKHAIQSSLPSFLPPARLLQIKDIITSCFESLCNYFEDYPEDGGCDEGAQYWEHSVGHFFECAIWEDFPINQFSMMCSYIYRVHMTGDYYVNFADCAARIFPNASMILLMGFACGHLPLVDFGAYLYRMHMETSPDPTMRDNMDFRAVLNAALASSAIETFPGELSHRQQEQINSLSLSVFRRGHFCVATKGGHNGENHNHNDVGNVIVYADGKPILIDVGVGAYTKDTFSDRRYTIWTMQSSYHNLPEINGCMQQAGKEFCEEFTGFSEETSFCICGDAYPRKAGLSTFARGVNIGKRFVKLVSTFMFQKPGNHVALNYMLAEKPELSDCCARVNGCLLKLPKGEWSVETVEFGEDEKLSPVWGHCVYRLRGEIDVPKQEFTAVTIIEPDKEKPNAQKQGKMPKYTVIRGKDSHAENKAGQKERTDEKEHRGKDCPENPAQPTKEQMPNVLSPITYQDAASEPDIRFMGQALEQAKKASAAGDVPIGCVITHGEEVIARAYNMRNQNASVLAHAEILAIEEAAKKCQDFRLEDCTLYVTLEPCPMCAGAIVQARIPRVVIGTMNPKAGCAGSILNILQTPRFNHQVDVTVGVCREECSALLSDFFRGLRNADSPE